MTLRGYEALPYGSVSGPAADQGGPVRGECPSISKPFLEVDGALLRLSLAGGRLTASEIGGIASALELLSGHSAPRVPALALEITSRANLQIRGVPVAMVGELQQRLSAVMADHKGTRRTVMASPTAGSDPTELFDVGPLVAELSSCLGQISGIHPKFGVLVDGGGSVSLRGRRQMLCFGAVVGPGGRPWFELTIGEPLPSGPGLDPPALLVRPEDVVEVAMAAAELVSGEPGVTDRAELASPLGGGEGLAYGKRLGSAEGPQPVPSSGLVGRLRKKLRSFTGDLIVPAGSGPIRDLAPSVMPIGKLRERAWLRRPVAGLPGTASGACDAVPERWSVGAMPLLGRLSSSEWSSLADLVGTSGAQLRLTPWRSVLLVGVPDPEAAVEGLGALGFLTDPTDPALGVVACAGSTGCPSGATDTQSDGRQLAQALTAGAARVSQVHLSGCSKRCAGKSGHDVTLVGGPASQVYDVYSRVGDDDLGRLLGRQMDPPAALGLVEKELAGE